MFINFFTKKKLIYSSAVILSTLLTVTILIVNNKKYAENTQGNNIVAAEQTEQKNEVKASVENTSEASQDKEDEVKILTYTVKLDDTLETIANAYGIDANTIAESNNLTASSTLKEGQILEFPSVNGVLYKIQNGETLWDLALLNKVDFNKIVEINKLEAPEKLKLGQRIIIPDVTKVKPAVTTVASNAPLNRGGSISSSVSASLPVQGTISSKYGARWGKQHAGIDIAAPTGTNVYASMAGKVTFSGWEGGYGNLIIIDHGNGLQTYYAHNSKLLVKNGQSVTKGTHIADVGSTGNSTGPHSHFEIRKNGTPVNPYNYIK